MRIGIRTQLISASVFAIVVIGVVLTATSAIVLSRTLTSQVERGTAQVQAIVEGELALRRRDLEHAAEILAVNEQFRSHVHYASWPDATGDLEEIRKTRNVDVALCFDEEHELKAVSGIPFDKAVPFTKTHVRDKLLRGVSQSLIEPIGNTMYVISAEKVEYFGNERGELVLFQALSDSIARDIQKKVGPQVFTFDGSGTLSGSLPVSPELNKELQRAFGGLATHSRVSLGSVHVGEASYFTSAFALDPNPNSRVAPTAPRAGVAFAVPMTDIQTVRNNTLVSSIVPAILFTFIVGLLALALANQIARPIAAMAEQFSRISASGDLSLRVQESLGNEIGDMARSFNGMQERVEQLHGRVVQAEERMRKELQMASTVQEMLFQQEMPHNRACEVAAYTSTLVETSGDWYSVFDDVEAKRTIFIIADATGHGASAALLTAITHGFFQTMWTAKQGGDAALSRIPPATILSMLNSVVLNSAHGTITATVFVGVLHHGSRKMVYASAGHIPPIVTRWTNNEMKANILTCNPSSSIGSSDKPVYEDYTVELPPEALVLIYTDGLTEVENPQGLQWGVRKLISVLRGCQTDTVEGVRQKVLDSVTAFARGKELQDDLTYLTVRIL